MAYNIRNIPQTKLLWLYETMRTIRSFEERFMELLLKGRPVGTGHLSSGQEAVPTGICAHLSDGDYLASTHRGHGHCIAKGVDPKRMMAELYGRIDGTCKGKGGSMHIADFSKGMLGANGVVDSSIPLAVGAALSAKIQGKKSVAVAFFGDGGLNQGVLYESMNLAAIWGLAVLFVCENNRYAESTPIEYATSTKNPAERATGFNMPGVTVDGQDVFAVYDVAAQAVERARSGQGPTFMVADTYRYHGHYTADNPLRYRLKDEEERFKARDCLLNFRKRVIDEQVLDSNALDAIDRKIGTLMDAAVEFAEQSPYPPPSDLFKDVYVNYPYQTYERTTHQLHPSAQ